ncbi:hypothetical protein NNO_0248 [Hydrogenimonas sp.]|nr:hypothetical protein NNO_0248 [Hydrogenimonas sp.]
MEKEEILEKIEKLLSFDGNDTAINPAYLKYFTLRELENILQELEKRYENMVEENLEWMRQFKSDSDTTRNMD